jgi:single-strand DNA-binding protein
MSTLKNSVKLIGNVGQTPEIKNLENGKKVVNFSIATNEVFYNSQGEKVSQTYWHNLVAWGKTAKIIENYVEKGKEIAVEGKLVNRTYETKDGYKRHISEILVNEVFLLGRKN